MPDKTKRETSQTLRDKAEPTYQNPRVLLLVFGAFMLALIAYGFLAR